MDGNAYFFTAVDVSRRLEFTNSTRAVVVGIGYPPSKYVYDWRRGPDLTPASADGTYEMPLDDQGKPRTDLTFGEAGELLDFIQNDVMTHVHQNIFPQASLETGRKALFGHSYGGIFTLFSMFTRPTLFNTFIAASPVIWWNKSVLVKEHEVAFCQRKSTDPAPSLLVTWGSGSQDLEQELDESEEDFKKRKSCAEDEKMRESASALVSRLRTCPGLRGVWNREFLGEDHGSAAVTGLQHGIMKFLVDKI